MMMFPNASKGYMPFCPSYEDRKKTHDRRTRHRSGEEKKRRNSANNDPRKTHSTPQLAQAQYKIDKADLRFMSVPNLDLSRLHELWEEEDEKVKNDSSVLKAFLGLFKKGKTDKVRAESTGNRKHQDSEKENSVLLVKPRLESIREEDENVDTSNSSVSSSNSSSKFKSTSSVSKPVAAVRRHRTAMTALGTSPTSEAPAKKCATHIPDVEEDVRSTSSLASQEGSVKSQSDVSNSSSSIEKQG